jgi:hypothetical protein
LDRGRAPFGGSKHSLSGFRRIKTEEAAHWRPLSIVSPNQTLARPVPGSEWISFSEPSLDGTTEEIARLLAADL